VQCFECFFPLFFICFGERLKTVFLRMNVSRSSRISQNIILYEISFSFLFLVKSVTYLLTQWKRIRTLQPSCEELHLNRVSSRPPCGFRGAACSTPCNSTLLFLSLGELKIALFPKLRLYPVSICKAVWTSLPRGKKRLTCHEVLDKVLTACIFYHQKSLTWMTNSIYFATFYIIGGILFSIFVVKFSRQNS